MSKLTQRPTIELNVGLQLTEIETKALYALAGYGIESFLKVFYAQMGTHYLEPHEAGLRSLFATIVTDLPPIINRMNAAKTAFALQDPVIRSQQDHGALIERLVSQAGGQS